MEALFAFGGFPSLAWWHLPAFVLVMLLAGCAAMEIRNDFLRVFFALGPAAFGSMATLVFASAAMGANLAVVAERQISGASPTGPYSDFVPLSDAISLPAMVVLAAVAYAFDSFVDEHSYGFLHLYAKCVYTFAAILFVVKMFY